MNVVLNYNMDTASLKKSIIQISRYVNTLLEEMGLVDVWRNLHPLEKDFTHYPAVHKVHSRIDYLFVDTGNAHRVNDCHIGGADVSDHCYVIHTFIPTGHICPWRLERSRYHPKEGSGS